HELVVAIHSDFVKLTECSGESGKRFLNLGKRSGCESRVHDYRGRKWNRIVGEVCDRLPPAVFDDDEVFFFETGNEFVAGPFHSDGDNDEIDLRANFIILSARCHSEQQKRRQYKLSDCPYFSPHSTPSSLGPNNWNLAGRFLSGETFRLLLCWWSYSRGCIEIAVL